ncbi:MAG: histidine kinase dimerization/phospho-acceptor domain-containing protein, partial [Cyanobacteria bacterium J06642_12]
EKELNDLKLNFFSLASHELRTPLSGILVATQLLQQAKGELSAEKRSRNLRRIQSAAKTMAQLLADILILTRAEAGKLEFNPEPLELQPFCQRLIDNSPDSLEVEVRRKASTM